MNKILADNLEKIREYCKKYKVKELYAVGSVIGNSFNQESDIDFLIEFKNISIADYTDNYFELHKLLNKMLNRKIDLITKKSLKNPYLIKSLEENRELIYGK